MQPSFQLHHKLFLCVKGGRDCVMEVRRNGTVHRKMSLPDHLLSSPRGFSSFLLFNEVKITGLTIPPRLDSVPAPFRMRLRARPALCVHPAGLLDSLG